MKQILHKYQFLFEELVKRDFKKRYKRTSLGMLWSMLSTLMQLLVFNFIFSHFFGGDVPHYTVYLFAGVMLYTYFTEATTQGMSALMDNADIITHINIPKALFLISKNMAALINFGLTFLVFLIFALIDGVTFTWKFFLLLYPIACFVCFNIGVGFILSALYIFFKDMKYIYSIVTMVLMYGSAVFYSIDSFAPNLKVLFKINPLYDYISYFRSIVIYNQIPGWDVHLICGLAAAAVMAIGLGMYKKYNYKFLYYV